MENQIPRFSLPVGMDAHDLFKVFVEFMEER